jgi:hypothetical protein
MEHVVAHVGGATLSADLVVHGSTDEVAENRTVLHTVVRAKSLKASGGKAQERWDVDAKQALFQSELDWGDVPIAGPVRLFLRGARAGMRITKVNGDAVVDLRLASVDRKSRSGEVSGTIRVKNADIATGDRHVEKWWGALNLERTRVSLDNDVSLDGSMTTTLKDGVPLLFMLSERDKIPDWLPEMLPLNNLTGKISVHKSCQLVDVIVPQLAGGPLSATGRVTRYPDEVRGAVLVRGRRAGLFSAGIGIGKKSGGLSLFAGDDWLKGHLEWLRNATASMGTGTCEKPPEEPEKNACER